MNTKRCRRWIPVLLCLVLFAAVLAGLLLFARRKAAESSDFSLPGQTRVVLHFSTSTAPGTLFAAKPQSRLAAYDAQGKILNEYVMAEEIVGPFLAKRENGLALLRRNGTILSGVSQSLQLESENAPLIEAVNFGSSQSGYLEDLHLTYSLLNVGKPDCINTIRFVSDTQSYDVAVPYELEDLVYDRAQQQMYCIIHSGEPDAAAELSYVIVRFQPDAGRFVLQPERHVIPDGEPVNIHYRRSMLDGTTLYSAVYRDTAEYMADPAPDKERTACDLVLCTYDLGADKKQGETALVENFDISRTGGDLLLSGSNQLPMCAVNDHLYLFLQTGEVLVTDAHGKAVSKPMPYTFEDTLNLKNPSDPSSRGDFFSSEIKVDTDGEIYILNLFSDRMFRIHRLCDGGKYELVWAGRMPENIPKNMSVNDFALLS